MKMYLSGGVVALMVFAVLALSFWRKSSDQLLNYSKQTDEDQARSKLFLGDAELNPLAPETLMTEPQTIQVKFSECDPVDIQTGSLVETD